MNRSEFLEQLKKALENELDAQDVKENVDYYKEYIRSEMQKGQSEEEVLEQLGDPWAIAKTILLSNKMNGHTKGHSSEVTHEQERVKEKSSWGRWKLLLIILVALIVLSGIFSMAFGLIAALLQLAIRYAVPILVIVLIVKMLKRK